MKIFCDSKVKKHANWMSVWKRKTITQSISNKNKMMQKKKPQLYTDLSGYYDLMCADINYLEQSDYVRRLHQLFGNQGKHYLDLACGTGPHIRHFIDFGFTASGVDINQPMLDIAQLRCPEAQLTQQDMSNLNLG